jgi:hypothetical protein
MAKQLAYASIAAHTPTAKSTARNAKGMKIIIEALPQNEVRNSQLGDWFERDGNLIIQVAGVNPFHHDEAFLVAIHELVEAKLCARNHIPQIEVDEFDENFTGDGEPGDAWNAPYRREHRKAMLIEHLMADWLGLAGYGEVS